jgi:dihydrofolate reductase
VILSAIAAMAKNRVIGKDNKLPWHLPEDLKFFKEKTKSRVLIMGRKTFDSLLVQMGGKPLPGRFHIVITRNESYRFEDPLVQIVPNMKIALELAHMLTDKYKEKFGDEVFVIGGGEIYRESLDILNRIYLTVIEKDFEGDAKFPEFSESEFKLTHKADRTEPLPFSFRTYERES